MTEQAVQTQIVVRRFIEADSRKIAEFLESSETKTSMPKIAYAEENLRVPGAEVPLFWHEELEWVAEKAGLVIAHFRIWRVSESQQHAFFALAVGSRVPEADVISAVDGFLDIMFREKKLHKVCLMVHPETLYFYTLAQHLSLILEGTLRSHFVVQGAWYDVAIFSLTFEERELAVARGRRPYAVKDEKYDWLIRQAEYDNVHVGVVRAIILQMGKENIRVLLLKKSNTSAFPGAEEPPGGKILEGETLFQALQRAVLEQTGLEISEDIYYLTAFDFTTDKGQRIREFVFRVKPMTWKVEIDPEEHQSFSWMLLQDLPRSQLHPDLIQVLSSYSPTLAYETEGTPLHEHEAAIELVRPPNAQLDEVLLVGHHLDAYAAKGLPMVEPIGLILRDSANRIVGGLHAELLYGSLFIRRMWVDPSWRRAGWGRKLIARAESIAREKGMTFAATNVMDWEFIPFFQKLGYTIEGQHTGYLKASRQFRFRKDLLGR